MPTPKTLREALFDDVMIEYDTSNIKRGLKNPPVCIENWGITTRWEGNCAIHTRFLSKAAIRVLHHIIHILITHYVCGKIEWTPTVRDLQDDKPELLFCDDEGLCRNSSSEAGRLTQIFGGRLKSMLWKYFRGMEAYSEAVATDDVIHEKIEERKRRLIINMYVDAFMTTWHMDNLRKILLLRSTSKKIKNCLDSEDDMAWIVMFEEPTNTTIQIVQMLKSYT